MSPLLLVDDSEENLRLLERTLEWCGYKNIRSCTSGHKALKALAEFKPHLVILDLVMPGMDGYQVLEQIRSQAHGETFLPILVFTADLAHESKIKALSMGASDFLTKPGDPIEIQLRVRNFLQIRHLHSVLQKQNDILETRVRERTENLLTARREAVEVLSQASEYRDDDTGRHACRVGELSAAIAAEMGLDSDFVEMIRLVAPLHDLGKIAIPDFILHKPGSLTDEEYEAMKRHVKIGGDFLAGKSSPLLQLAHEIATYHHERWDGKGYGAGLAGADIPLSARIVTVADAFDAMTNDRPYRKARPLEQALEELKAMAGVQFDPEVVASMFRLHQGRSQKEAA